MPTIRQLAQLAGVSIWTVSLALRDSSRIRPEVRQRVKELADLYHYRSNRLVQGALTGKSGSIGCLIPAVRSPFFSYVLEGVLDAAFAEAYEVIPLQLRGGQIEHVCKALQTLTEKRVEGILIASAIFTPLPRRAILELWSHNIVPIALQGTATEIALDIVQSDWHRIAALAVDYLYQLGHRRMVYAGFMPAGRLTELATCIADEVACRNSASLSILDVVSWEALNEKTASIFRQQPQPTAIIALSDMIAGRFVQQAVAHHLRVPEDLSVLSCSGSQFRESFLPPLTAIDQHPEEVGRAAAELLFRRILEGKAPSECLPETILIAPELLLGKSCTPPRKYASCTATERRCREEIPGLE